MEVGLGAPSLTREQVLFFVDYDSLAGIKEKFAIYADKFDPFALESNAMSQYLGMLFPLPT